MSRFSETEEVLIGRLRNLKAAPEVSINLNDISAPMKAVGFSQSEIIGVLNALEQDKVIAYTPGNRVLMLKDLPD
ncbi:putative transcriptional regulator [Rhizobium skierniewicense]|uniref:Putative transcriptional regulator n=1 Tax=Rhizobium skierniewicense TaxID=984260 RepID=A0A7W6C3L3_9HYPH|nr:hypothetical protein [Rhizobium skierniewicense]MBB3945113.1 putative transcriptional regulator [Rhizobium skierniewicense]NTF34469.1 hypothetical protein [Rhizobium skierniewicense]